MQLIPWPSELIILEFSLPVMHRLQLLSAQIMTRNVIDSDLACAVTSSPAVPLGLSAFSIWGNGVASNGNGFLGAALHAPSKAGNKSEKDLAHAREAGYFCPLTKAVIEDPVVASDGYAAR